MSNSWLRLWHDMPTDPKFRTIARASKQPLALVIAVYLHVLVDASNATERGRTQSLSTEDVASALDVETEQVELILQEMQGRLLENDKVTGWDKRQPKKEDGASERARAWREAKKQKSEQQENEAERNRTQPNAKKRPDTDTDTDTDTENKEKIIKKEKPKTKLDTKDLAHDGIPEQEAAEYFAVRKEKKASILTPTAWKSIKREAQKLGWTPRQAVLKCIEKGWRGFDAQWVINEQNGSRASPMSKQEAIEAKNAQVLGEWASEGREEVIDI